ncbi:MAG TPA: cytochrome c biogenesis protein CcsA [Dictyobacter sp.]|jgi:heme exporter protein C|nr:cytochrome c biogenesis protein CcsA [Dictyobacter sp.]
MAVAKQATVQKNIDALAQNKVGRRTPIISLLFGAFSAIGIALTIWMAFEYAPLDAIQGEPQRIFYIHVPMAWIGMLAFGVLALAGIAYLFVRDERLDWLARASAEIGVVFLSLGIIGGSLWGKPIWGAWWVWDPKLTACLILWFMFIGYIMLRSYMGRTEESARVGAVVGIIGVIDVPIIYLSVLWWRGQHPQPISSMPLADALTFLVAVISFTLLYCFLMIQVYQLQRLQASAERLRTIVM